MNKTIKKTVKTTVKTLALAALFIFPALVALPQEVPQEETPAAETIQATQTTEGNVNFIFPGLIAWP